MIAANLMTKEVKTLKPSNSIIDALEILKEAKIRQVPIVDNDNKVVGTITSRGLLKSLLPDYITSGDLKDVKFAPELTQFTDKIEDLKNTTVQQIIDKECKNCTCISPETSTMEVAALFVNADKELESVIVVDDEQRVLGVISPIDVYKRLWEYTQKKS